MTEPLIEVVSVELVPDPTVPTDRPCIVLSWDHDLNPAAPSLRWDIVASSILAQAAGTREEGHVTMRTLGGILHTAAHALLADDAAFLNLTAPGGGS